MSRRIRKHANPFKVLTEIGALDRDAVFGREAPLEIDIGCGDAAFLFERARNHPDVDFVGFEVRKPLVEAAMARREKDGPPNVVVYYANAHPNLPDLVPPGVVRRFYVMFPDPSFKKRHHKRRILQPPLARMMAQLLPIGGDVFVQSDVKPLAEEMYDFMCAEPAFEVRLGQDGLQIPSPVDERTHWEKHHEKNDEPIYRMLFEKVREPEGPIPPWQTRVTNPLHLDEDDGATS